MIPQLILDQDSVASSEGVRFQLSSATKHPLNPLLAPGRPEKWDSLQVSWPGTVVFDEEERLFKCFYSGLDATHIPSTGPSTEFPWRPGYAESVDGINWTKPDLGQVEHRGRPSNRMAVPPSAVMLGTVTIDPAPSSPERRFVGIWLEALDRPKGEVSWQKRLAFSPDGRTWDWDGPAVYTEGLYDFYQVLHDPLAPKSERTKIYAQAQYWPTETGEIVRPSRWEPHNIIRAIGVFVGPDVEHMREADNPLALAPEKDIDDELHFASVRRVGNQYVMLFESDRFGTDPLNGDIRLAVSGDGTQFRRVHRERPLVANGSRGMWDENLLVTNTAGLVEVGDELRIYYFGGSNVYRAWPPIYAAEHYLRGSLYYPVQMGMATLPLDRWACAIGPGTVTTFAQDVAEEGVWLNADGDGITVELLDERGAVVGNGTVSNERYRTYYRKVDWESPITPGRYAVRVALSRSARLYSVLS